MNRTDRVRRAVIIGGVAGALVVGGASGRRGAVPDAHPRWWKTDLHVHSITSGDAVQDVGVMSVAARKLGFNAIFLTDHGAGDNAPIGGVIANHIRLEDDIVQWKQATYGSPAATTDELATSPVHSGSDSLHLAATAKEYGESFVWYKRGPDLHEGRDVLRFSIDPTRLDDGSGMYVSIAVGGDPLMASESGQDFADDPTVPGHGYPPQGYVTADGQVLPGRSVVFVWEIGTPRVAAVTGTSRTIVSKLPYRLNRWNTYTVDVTKAIAALPAAIRPSSDEALTAIRLVAAAKDGTADGYIDDVALDATRPDPTGDEFVRRNRELPRYDAPGFHIFPSLEAGLKDHVQRFDYAITSPRQWMLFKSGPDSVPGTHAAGYPAQLNHPGLPGGVTTSQAVGTLAEGADMIEAVPRGSNEVMLKVWDRILARGRQVIGTWTSDAHRTEKLGPATYLYAPALTLDSLMRALYEGRAYMAPATFSGRVVFNVDASSDVPYPARYPVYVPPSQSLTLVHLDVSGGVPAGAHIVWIENGRRVEIDPAPTGSLDVVHSVRVSGPFTYVRAELRDASGAVFAMTEPIFFRPAKLPAGVSVATEGVTTANGRGYTRLETLGAAAPVVTGHTLSVGLPDRPGSVVDLRVTTGPYAPGAVTGAQVVSRGFDRAHRIATLGVRVGRGATTVGVRLAPAPALDTVPPTGLRADDVGATDVSLQWDPPGDPQAAIVVLRNGTPIAAVPPSASSYVDHTAQQSTAYTYALASLAFDGSASKVSASLAVKTEQINTFVLTPTADTFVQTDRPAVANGALPYLRVAGAPAAVAYLRFDLPGVTGRLRDASLRLWVTSGGAGYDVHAVPDDWSEAMTSSTAPAYVAAAASSSGAVGRAVWSTADVTPLLPAAATVLSFALTSSSPTTGVRLSSREGADPPQLVIHTES